MVRSLVGKHPKYFEAILQLREISKEVNEYVERIVIRKKIIIVKRDEVKNGFDYFLADNDQARALGKKLQQVFGGKLVVTSTLHTQKDSKEMYRVTILFREASFRRGNHVEYNGDVYVVRLMTKDIFLQDLKTGRKIHVNYRDMGRIKKIEMQV